MSIVTIVLRDTEDGLVDVETTVDGWDDASNAIALANRVNSHIAEIATPADSPKLVLIG